MAEDWGADTPHNSERPYLADSLPVGAAHVQVLRDGAIESTHAAHIVVASPSGQVLAGLGDADLPVYVRSAVKPFQALAVLELLERAGEDLDTPGLAIACASHTGSATHQIEAARLLALAGLDESALRCPPALPADVETLLDQRVPEPLAHNCSGKHAAFLFAQVSAGADPARYLEPEAPIQQRVREQLVEATGAALSGPGVDGCGAPAWMLPLRGLAVAFARLAGAGAPESPLGRVAAAMRARPDIIGGLEVMDTRLMQADARVLAKRGAEAVFAAGVSEGGAPGGAPVGIAVKIADGGARAVGPLLGIALAALGCAVPEDVLRPVVLGGGRPQGHVELETGAAEQLVGELFALQQHWASTEG